MTSLEVVKEMIVFGLRMKQGLDTHSFTNWNHGVIADYLNMAIVEDFVDKDLLLYSNVNGRELLKATVIGFPLIDKILSKIML